MSEQLGNEAIYFLIDDSAASVNRDYENKTRLQAQAHTVRQIMKSIKNTHSHTAVGLMTIGGKVVNEQGLTQSMKPTLDSLEGKTDCKGTIQLRAGIKTAAKALSTRKMRNQTPHIIVFVASSIEFPPNPNDPSEDPVEYQARLAAIELKQARKNLNASIDLISLNTEDEQTTTFLEKLRDKLPQSWFKYVPVKPNTENVADAILGEGVITGLYAIVDLDGFMFDDDEIPMDM